VTHELKHIIQQALLHQQKGLKSILATVVFLEGSSYRKPGVRMLICEDGTRIGAVSGGCIENEINRRAQSIFKDNKAKVITYDGRYRLGCEGILYILIEPFFISKELLQTFSKNNELRESFKIESYYKQQDESIGDYGSVIHFNNNLSFTFNTSFSLRPSSKDLKVYDQTLEPCFRLIIIGGEHDAVKLCTMASLLGWEVDVVTSIKDPKQLIDFPGAKNVMAQTPETIDLSIDTQTAVVLMTHNYVQDLKYLLKLEHLQTKYIGVLGSTKRREQLQNELIHYVPELSETVLDSIYSPAGLHIGAITPEEIALSILSEILSVHRKTEPISLKTFTSKINSK